MSTGRAWMLLAFWREKDRFYDVRLLLFLIGQNIRDTGILLVE